MVVDSRFHNLRDLSLHFQDLLRSHFPQSDPIQVFCMLMRHKLLVMVQHSARAMPDEQAVGQLLTTTLEHDPPASIQFWLAQTHPLQVELFLRVVGNNQVYASGIFDLSPERRIPVLRPIPALTPMPTAPEPFTDQEFQPLAASPPSPELTPSPVMQDAIAPAAIPEPEPDRERLGDSFELTSDQIDETVLDAFQSGAILAEETAEEALEHGSPLLSSQEDVRSEPAPLVKAAASDRNPVPTVVSHDAALSAGVPEPEPADLVVSSPAAIAPEAEINAALPRQRFQLRGRKRWLVAGAAGLAAIATGVYALTRPCVLGDCQNLAQAQALDAAASATIQNPQSAQAVVDAYDQWIDASYLLQQVPPWSRFYAQTQQLLQAYEERMGTLRHVVQAQRQAYAAAVKSQNPPHPVDTWREIRVLWQEAIALLQLVPAESSVYPLAQQKLQEYESNLQAIDRRIETERAAQSKIQSAREAATVAEARQQVATSLDGWQQTYATWQAAIALLQQVPANTMSHAEARQLLDIYESKRLATRDRLQQETIAQNSYQQALSLADQAVSYEQSQQWSQAVVTWRDALNQAQQVPKNTTYHDQAQPLIMSYRQALSTAETQLRMVVSRQEAATQLAQFCATSGQCTQSLAGDRLQIQVVQPALGAGEFPLPGSSQPISEPFNALLRSVAEIAQRSQVKVDVFNGDGSLFGTYTPDVNGYVPPSSASTPEPYRF